MELRTDRNCHALYNLKYYLVLVTKYRKRCINEDIFSLIKMQTQKIAELNGGTVDEINYEPDHVYILLSMPPQACLSSVINNIKTTASRLVRKQYATQLARYYWKPYFWNRSYLILSSGGAPIEVIKKYIQEQGTTAHYNKKQKTATNPT